MNKAKYDLLDNFKQLESRISEFSQQLSQLTDFTAVVFRLPDIMKGDENKEISEINVEKFTGLSAIKQAIDHFNLLFLQDKSESTSNKSAIRLPGAICVSTPYSTFRLLQSQLDEINQLKKTN